VKTIRFALRMPWVQRECFSRGTYSLWQFQICVVVSRLRGCKMKLSSGRVKG